MRWKRGHRINWVWPVRAPVLGGESTSCLLMMGGQGSVCTPGLVPGGSRVWGRLRRGGSRMQGGNWWRGQLVLGCVPDGVQCGDGPGQYGKTARMLEGRGQYPVPEGLWPCRWPWASRHLPLSFVPRSHHLRRGPASFRRQTLIPGTANPVPLHGISSQAARWDWMLGALHEIKDHGSCPKGFLFKLIKIF